VTASAAILAHAIPLFWSLLAIIAHFKFWQMPFLG